jgi:phenylpyruvate tautomerase PptA (4-oxalocrotonate tautomerase family)
MPTYIVTAPAGRLSANERQNIASDITEVHKQVTGAQSFFAQVYFQETLAGTHFMGGVPVKEPGIFVHGHIRAGRTAAQKRDLLRRIVEAIAARTGIKKRFLWAYVNELPPEQMVEYGHVLPEPGDEENWLASLPAADRAHMQDLTGTNKS